MIVADRAKSISNLNKLTFVSAAFNQMKIFFCSEQHQMFEITIASAINFYTEQTENQHSNEKSAKKVA